MKEVVTQRTHSENATSNKALRVLALAGFATAGSWIAYSATMIDHNLPLPLAINSERHLLTSGMAGLLNYYTDLRGEGRPLLLLHSINVAASTYEMQPIFENYRGRRPVYALDLPGFGFSERSDRYYSPKLYTAAIRDFLANVVQEPADVIALSLSSEFAARAALENSEHFHSLTIISPTGLSKQPKNGNLQRSSIRNGSSNSYLRLFSFPLWSQALYDLLTTRPSIRYFLDKNFNGPIDEGLAAYSYLSAHQPGARYAPVHFISGKLSTPEIYETVYKQIEVPGLLIYDQDPYTSFDLLPDLLLAQAGWSAVRISPTRGLPQFEQMAALGRVLDNFWKRIK